MQPSTTQHFKNIITICICILIKTQSQDHGCTTPYECNTSINITGTLGSNGYKSAIGSVDITANSVQCSGSFSCSNISSISAKKVQCQGANSCTDIKRIDVMGTSTNIWCAGSNSCQETNFNSSLTADEIECSGFLSCANSQISEILSVIATGAYSLVNATIYSTQSQYVQLDGDMSGYGAKIYCQPDHSCTISCSNNGCKNFQCFGNCTVLNVSRDTIFPIITPFNTSSQLINSLFSLNTLINTTTNTVDNDELCSMQPDKFTYDNSQENNQIDILSNASICCRGGWSSCSDVSANIISNSSNKSPIICSGYESCDTFGNIRSNGFISCSGFSACSSANIKTNDNVYCIGKTSCDSAHISNAADVYCFGSEGCKKSTIISDGITNIFFSGYLSGESASVYCNKTGDQCFIYCNGYHSCDNLQLYCNDNCQVNCTQDSVCPPGYQKTIQPTESPTKIPTKSPSNYPTINPSKQPTSSPQTVTITTSISDSKSIIQDEIQQIETTFTYATIGMVSLFILIALTGFIDATYLRTNDIFSVVKIIQPLLHALDTMSDIFLCCEVGLVYSNTKDDEVIYLILLCCMIAFILIPMTFSIVQLFIISNKHWINNQDEESTLYMLNTAAIQVWFEKYAFLLYITSIITGSSFSATSLFNSNLYTLPIFDMGLSQSSLSHFKTKRVYSIVLCENVPQLVLQLIYWIIGEGKSVITIVSMIFSAISVVVTLLSIYQQRRIINTQHLVLISFDVCGHSISKNSDKLRCRLVHVRDEFSQLLGEQKEVIEVTRPRIIQNGIQMVLLIKVAGDVNEYAKRFEKSMRLNDANGSLLKVLKNGWNVDDVNNDKQIQILNIHLAAKKSYKSKYSLHIELSKPTFKQETTQEDYNN